MFVRKRIVNGVVYYQALESYRADGKPKHRAVAAWSAPDSLAEALRRAEKRLLSVEHLADTYSRAQTDKALWWKLSRRGGRRAQESMKRRADEYARALERGRAKVTGLRRAFEMLGDWCAPEAGRPAVPMAEAA